VKYLAAETFLANTTNGEVSVLEGVTLVEETDEVYWRYTDKFAPYKERPAVEQATSAPGEKRGEK